MYTTNDQAGKRNDQDKELPKSVVLVPQTALMRSRVLGTLLNTQIHANLSMLVAPSGMTGNCSGHFARPRWFSQQDHLGVWDLISCSKLGNMLRH